MALADFVAKCYAPRTVPDKNRRYERIEIELPCRLYIPEGRGEGLKFEAFARSQNLGLGGVFLESTFLLKPEVNLWVELGLPGEALSVNGRIAHTVGLEDATLVSGMGVEFLDVDSHARERLLRYFTPERYHVFFEGMVAEFPHLEKELSLEDVSLMVNLWEEWKVRKEGGPAATASGAPEAVRRKR